MKKIRTLKNGKAVTVHNNDGIRKRCECPRRSWSSCPHAWHFSFKGWHVVKGSKIHHRFPLDKHAVNPIVTREDAMSERDRLRALIRNRQFPPVSTVATPSMPSELTFETFGEKWRTNARSQQSDNQKMNDTGIVRRLGALELKPGATLAQCPIGLLTVDDWEGLFAKLGTLKGSSFNKYRQAVLAMQEWGVDKGYLSRPWLTTKVTKKGGAVARRKGARRDRRLVPDVLDKEGRVIRPGEEARLMEKASPWLQRLIVGALETGMRRGELLGLQWQDVSMARGKIMLKAERTKTRTMREIPISPRLLGVLKMVEHDLASKERPATDYVFGDAIGRKIADPKKSWGKAITATGITDLHFHDLRHEAGSRLLEQGWPLHHVQKMLGHEDAKTTSIYLNATALELDESMKRYGTGGGDSLPTLAQGPNSEPPPPGNDFDAATPKALVN